MIVRGKAQWASVFEPNELSGKYQVDICNLDGKTVKELEAVGIDEPSSVKGFGVSGSAQKLKK